MSSSQLEEVHERKRDEHVARQLGISIETLHKHPHEIEPVNHGMLWRITWSDEAPAGVKAHGSIGSQWSDIYPLDEPDESER